VTAEGAAWENPLMPNARLRQIYLAMMQARALGRVVPVQRGGRSTTGLEACLVSPTVDLGPTDLVCDLLSGGVIDFLRGVPAAGKKKRKMVADCGRAANLSSSTDPVERIWTAVGAAAAVQSLAVRSQSQNPPTAQPGVVVLYLLPGEANALLKKVFKLARDKHLPMMFVVLPASGGAKNGRISDLALSCRVPAIPTDAADAVAIYRVTQESIGHARLGGGPAVVECIPFALAGKRAAAADAIGGLEHYMLPRKVVTQAWLNREAKSFAKRLAAVLSNA
jgi:hypothetical protein